MVFFICAYIHILKKYTNIFLYAIVILMIAYRQILYCIGIMIGLLGGVMVVPFVTDVIFADADWQVFIISALLCIFVGGVLFLATRNNTDTLGIRDIFILIPVAWMALAIMATVPLYLSALKLSFVDAFFETVSGLTTTGATVLTGLDTLPKGILMWRSLLQWIGGVGIVVMASGVLPIMQIGGMQLLKLEFDPRMEKTLPRTAQLSLFVVLVYSILTVLCASLYYIFGMSVFDAINHAMTTIATGGYSTHDASLGFFATPYILTTSTVFMMVASLPFVLVITTMRGGVQEIWFDLQARWFFTILSIIVGLMIWNNRPYFDDFWQNVLHTTFNMTSVMTGTGYATQAYDNWGGIAVPMAILVMVLGGCAGSTTCGLKMFRLKVIWEVINVQMKKFIHPNGVFLPHYGEKVIDNAVAVSVMVYVILFLFLILIFTVIFGVLGYDLVTALSAATSSLACLGPGLGEFIGPNGNYQSVSDGFKWVFTLGMLIGRLEVFTVLIVLTPSFWRT